MNDQEIVIDIKYVFYKTLKQYKKILIVGAVIGLLAGLYKAGTSILVATNEEKMTEYDNDYVIKYTNFLNQGSAYQTKIDNLHKNIEKQEVYNEESVLMQIDPYNEYVISFSLLVDAGYEIMPQYTYQNENPTNRIVTSYINYLSRGELADYILENSTISSKKEYINELISVSNAGNGIINLSIISPSEEKINEISKLVKSGIEKSHTEYNKIANHKLTIINETVETKIDSNLLDTQNKNNENVSKWNDELLKTIEDYDTWKKSQEPEYEYSSDKIIKSTIKFVIIGFACGCILYAFAVALQVIFTDKVDKQYLDRCITPVFDTLHVGEDNYDFIDKTFRISENTLSLEQACGLLSNNVSSIMKDVKTKSIAVVTTESNALVSKICKQLNTNKDLSFNFIGNILEDSSAIKDLKKYKNVVIFEQNEVTKKASLENEINKLTNWDKQIVGIVPLQ